MFLFTYTAAILAFGYLAFAAFVLSKKRWDPVAVFLALHMIADALWIGSNAAADVARTDASLRFWSGLAFIGGSFFVSLYLCFVDTFIRGSRPRKVRLAMYLLPSVAFSLLSFSRYSVVETIFPEGQPTQIVPGLLYTLYPIFLFSSLVYGIVRLAASYRGSSPRRRRQVLYLELGFLALFLGVATFDVILPLRGELRLFNVGPQFSVFLIGLGGYAILKHRLLDIRIAVQRGLVYGVLLVCIVSTYLGALLALSVFLGQTTHLAPVISAGITSALGIFTVPHIERFFCRVTDKIFFKDTYDYGESMHELSEALHRSLQSEEIARNVCETLQRIFRAAHVRLVLGDAPGALGSCKAADEQVAPCIPIVRGARTLGMIVPGQKRSGDLYTDKDVRLLRTLSYQAAVALEKAELYAKVQEHSRRLEERVQERTAELERLQTEQRQMMLDISHALQTPLTVVKGELDVLKRQYGERKNFNVFEKSIDSVSRLIYSLLALARLESGQDEIPRAPVDLSRLLGDLMEYFAVIARAQAVGVTRDIEPGLVVLGRKEQLEELVTNLLSNALKYMADGERRIAVGLRRVGQEAHLAVSDTGSGIAPEDLPHVFARFYRTMRTPHPERTGSGLGLAIAKKIVEKHGGTIAVESVSGTRTTFTVHLPLALP